jgi:hypothetical protein
MADEFTFHQSQAEQQTHFQFESRQYVWISDQNSGSYPNGQLTFDLSSIANSGKYVDFSQSYLTIPLVMHLNQTSVNSSGENSWALSLKNGFHQLINSISVEITNCQVVSLTSFSNLDINYKLISKSSFEDVQNLQTTMGFTKDTAESISYRGQASQTALGELNNVIADALFSPTNVFGGALNVNKGRQQRMVNTSFNPNDTKAANFCNQSSCNSVAKNYCNLATGAAATDTLYYITATIPLRFLHDIFVKLPLSKGIYMRLIVNTNTQCISTIGTTYNSTGPVYNFSSVSTSSQNGVFPCMISPVGAVGGGSGFNTTTASDTVKVGLGICKSPISATQVHPTMSQCRIYCCMYSMSPPYEEAYLLSTPTKKVLYNDILSFQVLNIAPQGTVSQILTNGISRLRYLLIHPVLSATVNGTSNLLNASTYTAGIAVGSPMNSPFSSCPGTTCPFSFVTNFNVLISGTNLYQSSLNYGFEHWLQENRSSNAVNGGLSHGLSSGIISQQEYEAGYGFIFCDLSRKISQSSDDISRSVQLVFTNASNLMMDYYCILGYEREIVISTSTGALVSD